MRAPGLKPRRGLAVDGRPLEVIAFRRLWLASVVCAVGGSFSLAAIPTQLFTMTGSSATVGASAVVAFVALAAASLWTGALADLKDRRSVLLAAHCGLTATYAALWTQSALNTRSVPILMLLVGCQGLTYGAIMTTMGAVVPRLVPVELLPAANSLSSLVRYAGSIVGPVLAGLAIPLVGLGTLYLFDALALLVVVWAVAKLPRLEPTRIPGVRAGPPPERRPTIAQILAGFRYLGSSRLLVAVLAIDLSAMVFGMPVALFPELAHRTFGGPAGGGPTLGLLYAAYPIGVFTIGLLSGTFTRTRHHGALMAAAGAAWGITVVILGVATRLWIALVALIVGGAVNFALSTFRNAISQALTSDAMRGRIQGALTVVLIGGPQLANLLHGTAASIFGPRTVICTGGVLTTATVISIAWRFPELRSYTALTPSQSHRAHPEPQPAPDHPA